MIKINLVREGRGPRAQAAPGAAAAAGPANLNTVIMVGLVVAGLVLSIAYWFLAWRKLEAKKDLVTERTAEAQKLEAIIKEVDAFEKRKDSLENRIALINDLKRKQRGPVRIMDRISQDLPDLVWLDRMTLNGQRIQIEGRALNPNAVANFVENIKADDMFDEPEVSGLTQERVGKGGTTVYKYGMGFNFTYPGDPIPAGEPGAEPAKDAGAKPTTGSGT